MKSRPFPDVSLTVLLAFAVALLAMSTLAFPYDVEMAQAMRLGAVGATGAAWLRRRTAARPVPAMIDRQPED